MKSKIHFTFIEILYLLQIICCYIFYCYTIGFVQKINHDTYIEVSSYLMNPGESDDNVIAMLGWLSLVAFMISIWLKKKIILLFFYLTFSLLFFFLIQMGEIDSTILYGNYILLLIMLILGILTLYLFYLLAKKFLNKNSDNQKI